jgi:membrane protease YdiL (CAAX protease family)
MIYLKTRPAWSQLFTFIGLAFGCFLALGMIGMMILAKITGMDMQQMGDANSWDLANPVYVTVVRGMQLIQFLSLFTIPVFLFAYFSDPQPVKYLGLKKSTPFYFLVGGVILFIALPFVDGLGILNHQLIPENTSLGNWMKSSEEKAMKPMLLLVKQNSLQALMLNLLFIAIFAGVGEELFFRGVLQRILIRLFKSPMAGIVVASVLFSAIHFQFYGFLPRFALGMLLGLIYWYSGSLWPAIIAHVVYDAIAVVLFYFNPSLAESQDATFQFANRTVLAIISAVLVGWLVYLMKKKSTNSYEKVYAGDAVDVSNPFS